MYRYRSNSEGPRKAKKKKFTRCVHRMKSQTFAFAHTPHTHTHVTQSHKIEINTPPQETLIMADDERGDQGAPSNQTSVITLGSNPPVDDATMDDILDKLKLLNYEVEFCQPYKFKPLNRSYFVKGATNENASNQFFYFTSLVSWLMGVAGHKGFPPPGQYDEPNATSTNVLTELRVMGLPVSNLAPNRVRIGSGDAVLNILTLLTDAALLARRFEFTPVQYVMDKYTELQVDSDRTGGIGADEDGIDDHIEADSDDGDEMYVYAGGTHAKASKDETAAAITSQVSAEQWHLECERVGPLLQVRSEEIKDWRARIEGAQTLLKAVEKMYPDVKTMLTRMGDDLQKSADRIQKREQTLGQQFGEYVEDYRLKLRDLSTTQDAFNQTSANVAQLSQELNQVSESLDATKRDIEDRESKISDTTPLMQIKEAVTKVRGEIKQMALRIGVLQHTVLHHTIRQSKVKREGRTEYDEDSEFTL